MNKQLMALIICSFSVLTVCGCGGGGGGAAAPPAATKAVTTVSLFGAMSSSSKIATVQTTMTVPSGIMVNYSSAPGVNSGTFPLRSGAVVPSGPVQLASADISGTFNTVSKKLTINLFNNPSRSLDLQSSTAGNGAEVATLNFTLASPGVTTSLPAEDPTAIVSQDRSTPQNINLGYLNGCKVIFSTTYQ